MEWENRKKKIKKALLEKPYVFIFLIVFIGYLGLNAWINDFEVTSGVLFTNYYTGFIVPFLILMVLVGGLTALTVNLVLVKYVELKMLAGVSGFAGVGVFVGLLGGACPGCFAGLFPAFVGLFGVSATLGNLPLYGLEIQILSIGLLMISVFFLTSETKCKVKYKKNG